MQSKNFLGWLKKGIPVYDYVKLILRDRALVYSLLNNMKFCWALKTDMATAEVVPFPRSGTFENFQLTALSPSYLVIEGSIHRFYTKGSNHNRFTRPEAIHAIENLCLGLTLSPQNLWVVNLEFAVNMHPQLNASDLLSQVVCFNHSIPQRPFQNRPDAYFLEFELTKQFLKLYDKGLQCAVDNTFRFEIKGMRSQYFSFCGIKTLEDLKSPSIWNSLGRRLYKSSKSLLFRDDTIDLARLPKRELELYLQMSNPLNWIKEREDSIINRWRKVNRFKQIVTTYGKRNIYSDFNQAILEELKCLGVEM